MDPWPQVDLGDIQKVVSFVLKQSLRVFQQHNVILELRVLYMPADTTTWTNRIGWDGTGSARDTGVITSQLEMSYNFDGSNFVKADKALGQSNLFEF